MIGLFQTYTTTEQLSLKKILLAFFMCASVATCIGISSIQADESDPGDYAENTEVNFQNAAQEQHARNVAIKAALQDPEVMAAMENGDDDAARTLFEETVAEFMQQISDMRAAGEGWGNIAKDLDVHPKYLGLGHSKKNPMVAGENYDSRNKARGLALSSGEDKGAGHGAGHGHGNGGGNGGGHGGGKK